MADGSRKPIKEVRVGDKVLAADPGTGEEGPRTVTTLWIHDDQLIDLKFADGTTLTTTEDHPFWNHTDQQWQQAQNLDRGDLLLTSDGARLAAEGLLAGTATWGTAYNLTVDGIHTYYVLAGSTPVLVHNDPAPMPPIIQNAIDLYNSGRLSQRMTGPADARVPDVFRGDTGPIGARRFWGGATIYDVPGGGNDWRLLVKSDGTIGWVGPTGGKAGAGHNYDRISTYKPPIC